MSSNPNHNHRRTLSGFPVAPPEEDLEGQIDRLNQGLQELMNEIEVKSYSRNPSSLSILEFQCVQEDENLSDSTISENSLLSEGIEARFEEFLLNNDRNQMIIEDFRSEETRRLVFPDPQNSAFINDLRKENDLLKEKLSSGNHCKHDLNKLRKEIWLQVKKQKNEQNEKERKRFEENLEHLDRLKEDYENKRAEIMLGIEKLKLKEELLVQKEREAREQRLAFDRHKILWCRQYGIADPYVGALKSTDSAEDQSNPAFKAVKTMSHSRASSLSDFASLLSKKEIITPLDATPETNKKQDSEKPTQLPMKLTSEPEFINKAEQLRFYQAELKALEMQLQQKSSGPVEEISRLEINVDQLKNRIATVRGDIAMSESAKATKIISNMMVTMSREATRDEKSSITEALTKKIHQRSPNLPKPSERIPVKAAPIEEKRSGTGEITKQGAETGNSKAVVVGKGDENSKAHYDYQRKALFDKEKELAQREAFLQETWMKVPGAKELIENVNLTLAKMSSEKQRFEREREEFEKEKLEWIRNIEKNMMMARKCK